MLPALKAQGPQKSGMATAGRSTPRPRPSLSSLRLLLLLGCCLLAAAGKEKGAAREAAPASGPTGGSSGRFVSSEQHACSWQLLVPAPGTQAGGELALRCQAPGGDRLHCVYRGHPERCAASGIRRSHYWRRLLGALRRKPHPCLDPKPLPPRLCARKKAGAQLHPPARPTLYAQPAEQPIHKARSRAPPRQLVRSPSSPPQEKPSRAKTSAGGRKAGWERVPEPPAVAGLQPEDGLDQNAELTETYCTEKWHSLCNFFVNFWNG
ncbi:fibroblast growth factor-binding protein 3 [Sigmodon hispidus]